jgi:glutaredoxin 3
MPANSSAVTQPQKKIVVYTTDWCPYCVRAKRLLSARGYAFEEINVEGDAEKRAWLLETTGRRTVPQIFIDEQPVGGSDDLHELDRTGKLAAMVRGG